jgi:hypothetical protein
VQEKNKQKEEVINFGIVKFSKVQGTALFRLYKEFILSSRLVVNMRALSKLFKELEPGFCGIIARVFFSG